MAVPRKDTVPAMDEQVSMMTVLLSRIESIDASTKEMAGNLGMAVMDIRQKLGTVENKLDNVIRDIEGNSGEKPLPQRVERLETRFEMFESQVAKFEDNVEAGSQKQWKLWLAIINSFLFPIVASIITFLIARNLGGDK